MSSLLKKYRALSAPVKASLWFTVCSILQKGISFLTVPLFTRLLTADQFGLFNVYQSWLQVVSIFATLNLSYGVFNNGMIKYPDRKLSFTSSLQGLSTLVSAGVFLLYLACSPFLGKVIGLPPFLMICMFAEILVTPALGFWSARQRFEYKYRRLVLVTLSMSLGNAGVGLLAVLAAENKGVARVLSAAGVNIAVGLIFYVHNFLRGRKFCDREYWRFALAFNLPLIPHYLSQIVLSQSDRLMINAYCGTGKAGIYSVAFSAAMIMNIVVNGINASLVPWTYQKLQEGKRREIGKMCSGLLLVVAAGVWLVVMAAPEAVALLAPAEYREAIWVIPPLAVNVFLIFQYSLFANIEFYYEENKFIMLASTLAAVMNIGLNALFIPRFGYLAAGYTSFACYLIYCAAHYAFMRKVCRKHMQGKKVYNSYVLLGITLGLFLLCAAAMALYSLPLIRYGVVLLVLAAAAIRWKKLMDILRRLRSRR